MSKIFCNTNPWEELNFLGVAFLTRVKSWCFLTVCSQIIICKNYSPVETGDLETSVRLDLK